MKKILFIISMLAVFALLAGCGGLVCPEPTRIDYDKNACCDDLNKNHICDYNEEKPLKFPGVKEEVKMAKNRIATIETNLGVMKVELFEDKAPITTSNFINLSKKGFYDGLIFHRVIAGFMIQGGDPNGDGTGGPGYSIKDEFHPELKHSSIGILSMANSGPNTGGSQFFITLAPTSWLDGKHAVFGKLVDGEDVLEKIGNAETDENDKPVEDVVIEKITIG